MPPLTIKRKDPLVKAVRRSAAAQLDAAIAALTGPGTTHPDQARRDLLRLQSLLHLVRRPLDGEAFTRENRTVTRCLKSLPPTVPALAETLTELATAEPTIEIAELLDRIVPNQTAPPTKPRKKKTGPDPKQLRLVADLAEVRMRARYWHLPDGGFEHLAPGLRQSYQQAAKLTAPAGHSSPEGVAALTRLADQLQAIERAWPDLLGATRKALRHAQRHTQQLADLDSLRPHIHDQPELIRRLEAQSASINQAFVPLHTQLFAETPAAFAKRVGVLFDAWRA